MTEGQATTKTTAHQLMEFCCQALEGGYGPLIQVGGIILLVLIFNFAIRSLLLKLKSYFGASHNVWGMSLVTALQLPLSYFVWFVAALCTIDSLVSSLFDFHLNNMHLILSIGSVMAFGWFLLRLNDQVVKNMMEMSQTHKIALTAGKLDLIGKIATMTVLFLVVFLLMDVTGRNMQTLIAFGGIGGLALAFASQQVVANFFGGLMVYITQPFTIGEHVNLPEKNIEGHIEEIGWYLTRIRSLSKRPIYVPNSIFTQTVVITPSRMSHERFLHTIGLRYRDIKMVNTIIDSIKVMLLKHTGIDHQLPIEVFFKSFGPAALDIEISAYISVISKPQFSSIKQELLLNIAEIIEVAGAEIATPTNIVELHGNVMMKDRELEVVRTH